MKYLIVLLGLFTPVTTWAIGLGSPEIKSYLDDPFVVDVPLNMEGSEKAIDAHIKIASPAEYRSLGVFYNHDITLISSHVTRIKKHWIIRLTSDQGIKSPLLKIVMRFNGSRHDVHFKLLTIMLDPRYDTSIQHKKHKPHILYRHRQ